MPRILFPGWRLSIAQALVLGFGLLMLLAGLAYAAAMLSGRANTVELLRDRNQRIIDQTVERIRNKLEPVRQHVGGLRDRIEAGRVSIDDTQRLGDYLSAILDGVPQIDAVGVVRPDLSATRAVRTAGSVYVLNDSLTNYPNAENRLRAAADMVRDLQARHQTLRVMQWSDLIWEPALRQPLINLRAPLVLGDRFIGGMAALVSLGSLSRALEEDAVDGQSMNFILYDDNYVLAHPTLSGHEYYLSAEKPLPFLEEIHDPVLTQIWSGRRDNALARAVARDGGSHLVEAEGRRWIFLYQRLEGYGERPWLVGRYFPFDDIETEVQRLQFAAAIGGIVLLLALLIAWRLGHVIGRPVRMLAAAAGRLQRLDFGGPPLDRLRLRELDDAAQAVNAATAALSWFGNYVPRKLVGRLLREGEDAVSVSKQRDVTVLFTDIVGFTSLSETLAAPEVADMLNRHFELLAEPIEEFGGVIDKFIGDSVMAVWGAIKRDEHHAAHALRAVAAMCRALAADNARRRMLDQPVLRIRIGLHSGPVVVGNIGAPSRMNYTVVGDTVNIAQRLEQLGRNYMTDGDDFTVLASSTTVALAAPGLGLAPMPVATGQFHVKGRVEPVEVVELNTILRQLRS